MTLYTLRPNGTYATKLSGSVTPVTISTAASYVGDNSDATFIYNNANGAQVSIDFSLATASPPATEYLCRVSKFIRYKGDVSGLYTIGIGQYRSGSESAPLGYSYTSPSNSAAFTTWESSPTAVSWPTSDLSRMRVRFLDNRLSSLWTVTNTAEVGLYAYTIAVPTSTANAVSSTQSYPTLSASIVNTVTANFEANLTDTHDLRKVTVFFQVESGGTGIGTGTLITTTSVDYYLDPASLTAAITAPSPVAIANGTFKVYVRAARYREGGGSLLSDQYGAWSAAATLTQTVTLPTTPTITVSADNTLDRTTIAVTPVTTAGYSTPTIDVQRSDDSGTTWTAVRGATGISGTFGSASTFYDYEAPRGVTLNYRARVNAVNTGITNSSAWTANQTATIATDTWNLKVPQTPALNWIGAAIVGDPNESLSEDLGIFKPISSRYPVIVSGTLGGWDGDLNIQVTNSADWTTLRNILEAQKTLLLESPFGWSKYIRIIDGAKTVIQGTPTAPVRSVSLTYVQVSAP